MYVFAPQGRVSGISSIRFEQFEDMEQQGHATSSEFKTHSKYGLQAVIVNPRILELVQIYVKVLRQRALVNAREMKMKKELRQKHHQYLWLTWKGERDKRIGRHVTDFFKAHLGLHMTTTAIRSLVETTAHNALMEGTITPKERRAIQMINGHSSKTTEDYYHKHDRSEEANDARGAFNRLSNQTKDTQSDIVWPRNDSRTLPLYGSRHPDFGKDPKKKARWTSEETTYIGKFCTKLLKKHPQCHNVVAKCLDHILADKDCHAIFHPRHITDSSRLRVGWDKYQNGIKPISGGVRSPGHDPDWNSRMF